MLLPTMKKADDPNNLQKSKFFKIKKILEN